MGKSESSRDKSPPQRSISLISESLMNNCGRCMDSGFNLRVVQIWVMWARLRATHNDPLGLIMVHIMCADTDKPWQNCQLIKLSRKTKVNKSSLGYICYTATLWACNCHARSDRNTGRFATKRKDILNRERFPGLGVLEKGIEVSWKFHRPEFCK